MKNIFLLLLLVIPLVIISCSEEEPAIEEKEEEIPTIILDPEMEANYFKVDLDETVGGSSNDRIFLFLSIKTNPTNVNFTSGEMTVKCEILKADMVSYFKDGTNSGTLPVNRVSNYTVTSSSLYTINMENVGFYAAEIRKNSDGVSYDTIDSFSYVEARVYYTIKIYYENTLIGEYELSQKDTFYPY